MSNCLCELNGSLLMFDGETCFSHTGASGVGQLYPRAGSIKDFAIKATLCVLDRPTQTRLAHSKSSSRFGVAQLFRQRDDSVEMTKFQDRSLHEPASPFTLQQIWV
jgi:hypothetical protein